VLHQLGDQVGAAEDEDVATGLSLQCGDLAQHVAGEDDRVLPCDVLQGRRDDVLGDLVHPGRESLVVGSGGPERGPDLERGAAEQQCVG
jgi:hypothetical protein